MICFSQIGQYGRLGNQLFQYALVKSVSLKLDMPLYLPNLNGKVWHGQECLLPKFNIKYTEGNIDCKFTFVEKLPNQFDSSVFKVRPQTDFIGFFQHPSYFLEYKDTLLSEFSLKDTDQAVRCKDYLSKFNNPTSIHVRLGDYYHGNHCHENYLKLFKDYVVQAISLLPKNTDFLIFTGGSRLGNNDRDSDFKICKDLFFEYNFHYVEENLELIDLELIKNCKNTIMGWDSTFSWWASFLNENQNVICTDKYQKLHLQKLSNWTIL